MSGFVSAFASHALLGGSSSTSDLGVIAIQTAIAATIGGTVAELSGGNFANGAVTAAFVHLFNAAYALPQEYANSAEYRAGFQQGMAEGFLAPFVIVGEVAGGILDLVNAPLRYFFGSSTTLDALPQTKWAVGGLGALRSLRVGSRARTFVKDWAPLRNPNNWSAWMNSEGQARALARQKLGPKPVQVELNKWRSADGKWQYRAKPGDVSDNHVHLEELNPTTGEVLQNLHLRWPKDS